MINSVYSQPSFNTITSPATQVSKPRQGFLHTFDMELQQAPSIKPERFRIIRDLLFHPFESAALFTHLRQNPHNTESFGTRLAMYKALKRQLSATGRTYLLQELKSGRLTDLRSDDKQSTLSHLYTLASTPRAPGLDNKAVLEDTLRLLANPQTITQKFGTLKPEMMNVMLKYYNSGLGPKTKSPVTVNDLKVMSSATCVASSVMYYMARRCPSEFARHVSQLTSPRLAFYEKASLGDLSPEDPTAGQQKLADYGISATVIPGTNNQQYWVKVDLPYSGLIRALNQQGSKDRGSRGIVEAAYQGALTHLAVRSYDPGLDMRVNPDGTLDPNKGLEEDRKTLMETIIKDNGGVISVTYQFTASDREGSPYLVGYYRNFEKTTQDIMKALDMGEDVIIGITDTENPNRPKFWEDRAALKSGRINMGHELTVTAYERDKKTGEIIFTIADSDDDTPRLVKRKASEVVPQIHHAGFPVKLAQQIWKEIEGMPENQFMVPGPQEAQRYKLIATVAPNEQQAFLEEYQKMLDEEQTQQATETSTNQSTPVTPQPSPQPRFPQAPYTYQTWPNYHYPTNAMYTYATAQRPASAYYAPIGYPYPAQQTGVYYNQAQYWPYGYGRP